TAAFDYVILDTPALLPVADVQLFSSHVQGTILIVDASKTPRKMLLEAKHLLNSTHIRILGVVINKSPWPDYGAIRRQLNNVQRQGQGTAMTMPPNTPLPNDSMESMNGSEDPDSTLTLSTPPKTEGEKS